MEGEAGFTADESQGGKDDSDEVCEPLPQPTSLQETLGSSQQCSPLRSYNLSSPRTRPATPPTIPCSRDLWRTSKVTYQEPEAPQLTDTQSCNRPS